MLIFDIDGCEEKIGYTADFYVVEIGDGPKKLV
jgi:hypothetical protein